MSPTPNTNILNELISKIEIPDSYYQKAVARYHALGEWFCREGSTIRVWEPEVYPQGSFRLGTAIRPLRSGEEYDVDLVCELRGLSKAAVTQESLKAAVGAELRAYAAANGVKAPVREGKRAWRLDYADGVSFHLDILACVPEDEMTIGGLVTRFQISPELASTAIALTCTAHPGYGQITRSWLTSNPLGYGLWFEQQMHKVARDRREQLVKDGRFDAVAAVPVYALKTPLQQAIQLLKRQRDTMFHEHPQLKPISMLVTTLAARAYHGEQDLPTAIEGVLSRMPALPASSAPFVPNPVNPGEDFADKWAMDRRLQESFNVWVIQARHDFRELFQLGDVTGIIKHADSRFAVPITETRAAQILGVGTAVGVGPRPPQVIIHDAPRPWRK